MCALERAWGGGIWGFQKVNQTVACLKASTALFGRSLWLAYCGLDMPMCIQVRWSFSFVLWIPYPLQGSVGIVNPTPQRGHKRGWD